MRRDQGRPGHLRDGGGNSHSAGKTRRKPVLPASIGRCGSVLGLFKQDHAFPLKP